MIYVEAPKTHKVGIYERSLFLAGGITNCPNWQRTMINKLASVPRLVVFNPRRDNFPIHDPNASEAQIKWEFNQLKVVEDVLFWFSRGSLNPIVMFEYGKELGRAPLFKNRKLFVGVDPEYERKQDVIIQTRLADAGLHIFDTLDALAEEVKTWVEKLHV